MLTTWLGGLGAKLTENWAGRVLSPTLLFWLGGLGTFFLRPQGADEIGKQLAAVSSMDVLQQILFLGGALAVVAASEQLALGLALPVTRLIEGYWWNWLRLRPVVAWPISWFADRKRRRLADLAREAGPAGVVSLSEARRREAATLDNALHWVPSDPEARMPTRFGNILRSTEIRIAGRYGIDPIRCWSAMWLVLPEFDRSEFTAARTAVDARVQAWFWSVLFCVWAPISGWWPPLIVGLGLATVTYYFWLLPAARTYSNLLDAIFAIHRGELYKALGRTKPTRVDEEQISGRALTELLWHGLEAPSVQRAPRPSGASDP
jgi:hypothetical protein